MLLSTQPAAKAYCTHLRSLKFFYNFLPSFAITCKLLQSLTLIYAHLLDLDPIPPGPPAFNVEHVTFGFQRRRATLASPPPPSSQLSSQLSLLLQRQQSRSPPPASAADLDSVEVEEALGAHSPPPHCRGTAAQTEAEAECVHTSAELGLRAAARPGRFCGTSTTRCGSGLCGARAYHVLSAVAHAHQARAASHARAR